MVPLLTRECPDPHLYYCFMDERDLLLLDPIVIKSKREKRDHPMFQSYSVASKYVYLVYGQVPVSDVVFQVETNLSLFGK